MRKNLATDGLGDLSCRYPRRRWTLRWWGSGMKLGRGPPLQCTARSWPRSRGGRIRVSFRQMSGENVMGDNMEISLA